jgi:hypothetical protein
MKAHGVEVCLSPSGLCVSEQYSFIGATPDAIVKITGSPLIALEVKTVYDKSGVPRMIKDLVSERKGFYIVKDNGQLTLKKNHPYYYQVQSQLLVLDLQLANFVVYAPRVDDLLVLEIQRCERTCQLIIQKAQSFTNRKMLHIQFDEKEPVEGAAQIFSSGW